MRALLPLLAMLTVASIPWGPRPLPAETPVAVIPNSDCAAAQRDANFIAQALGYLRPSVTCKYSVGQAPLSGETLPRMPAVRNLIGYSVPDSRSFQRFDNFLTFQVPSSIPWVSSQATVVAYVKVDALLLDIRVDDILRTAFALENAGISREDISKEVFADQTVFVRVRPLTIARVLRIAQAARKLVNPSETFVYGVTAFVKDCDGTIAALSGLALAEARSRALVMARAAGASLGAPLAVIDRGGASRDAVCGLGSEASVHQLAFAARDSGKFQAGGGNFDAMIVRTISAAWRLNLPANPAGAYWRNVPTGEWRAFGEWPSFLADGRRSVGDSNIHTGVAANRVRILIPDWAEAPSRSSPYAADLTHVSFELSAFRPALILKAANPAQLTAQVENVRNYISRLPQRSGRGFDLGIVYVRDDCRRYVYDALYDATRKAMANLHGNPIRYVQERTAETGGAVSCASEPTSDDWFGKEAGPWGWAFASVAVGY